MVTLDASKPFRMLDAAAKEALLRIASERRFADGKNIFKEGDSGDGVYVVKEGRIEISGNVGGKGQCVFAEVQPGEMFGEMAVLELKPRSATATAVGDSVVYFIPRTELLTLIERSPLLAMELLKEISQRLREFNHRHIRELIQSERLAVIGRFARSIVHDIKNPLNVISLTAELSSMDGTTEETRKKGAVTIRRQVERISEMVGEILDFTQGTRNDMIFASQNYGTFLQQLFEELRSEIELRGSTLVTEGFPSVLVPLDARRFRRVFFNLFHNATDAMPSGGKIYVRFITNKNEVITEIEDTGRGIAPEIAGTLFEAFATFGKAHGTGLGLSITKKIVEDHRGRIWTRQEPGHGAIFCFSLPVNQNLAD